jgi:hypothetical protein
MRDRLSGWAEDDASELLVCGRRALDDDSTVVGTDGEFGRDLDHLKVGEPAIGRRPRVDLGRGADDEDVLSAGLGSPARGQAQA